jgi:2'-hydroxyisoflavone reductase
MAAVGNRLPRVDVLVLGGTSFVGRGIVECLLERGHRPALFNRGRTGADLFPGVERLVGDRDSGDYAALDGRSWDAVVDVTGYVPRHVSEVVAAVGDRVGRYIFLSTGLVYDRLAASGVITEASPRLPAWRGSEVVDDDTYGPGKVACEDDLVAHFGRRVTLIRPGWVAGPHDRSGGFTYWVRRGARGGRMAVPARLDQPMQVIDVRDLACLVAILIEKDLPGAYNAVGPSPAVTLGELIRACGGSDLAPVTDDVDWPLVLPDATWDDMFRISAAAAHDVGMPRTPLARTVADTLAWDRERGEPPLVWGITEEQESALLR